MAIDTLPTPPNRTEPDTFSARADAFLGALPDFGAQVNAAAAQIDLAEASATVAAASANFIGAWADQTGAVTVPTSVSHSDQVWLLINDLANVTTSEPGVSGDWITAGVLSLEGRIVPVTALDINCSSGTFFTKTIAANSTFTFSGAPADKAYAFVLRLTLTSGTITWPASVDWPAGAAPTLTTGQTHLFVFITEDAGTNWRGAAITEFA